MTSPNLSNFDHLTVGNDAHYRVVMVSDGTRTMVELVAKQADCGPWNVVGRGVALRRKTDKRDDRLGQLIAMQRAFEDAAKYTAEAVEQIHEATAWQKEHDRAHVKAARELPSWDRGVADEERRKSHERRYAAWIETHEGQERDYYTCQEKRGRRNGRAE